jgi:predicted DsbA family dithiol-disulfide isomerase
VKVEIWSDIACPWCYVGKRRLEAALAEFEHRDQVEVEWKSFELDPGAVSVRTAGESQYAARLGRKYGMSDAQAQQMLDQMTATAAVAGLDFRFDEAVAANTFDAHQLVHLAAARGLQDAVKERLLLAYFTEGKALGDRAVLVSLAAEAGLDPDEAARALEEQTYAAAVRADEQEASALGISGVPFFVFDRKYGVSGAQPAEQLLGVLRRAWDESRPLTMVPAGSDEACGPDGCAI